MIQCKVLSYAGAKTIEYTCNDCGRMQVRCFGKNPDREQHERVCWFCNKSQPLILNLILSQNDRIQYHLLSITSPIVSGIY
jgi:hypothetical protein